MDEYDDPVAKVLHDVPFAEKVRALLAIAPERVAAVSDEILEVNECAPNPIAVMYLEGYLTRTDYDQRSKMYRLGIPNEEIRQELGELYSVIRAVLSRMRILCRDARIA